MPKPRGEQVGDRVRAKREKLGLTQVQVAAAWGRGQPFLSGIETNERRMTQESLAELEAVMEHLAREMQVG